MTTTEWLQIQALFLAACLTPFLAYLAGGQELVVYLVSPFCIALAWGLLHRRLRTVRGDKVIFERDAPPPLR